MYALARQIPRSLQIHLVHFLFRHHRPNLRCHLIPPHHSFSTTPPYRPHHTHTPCLCPQPRYWFHTRPYFHLLFHRLLQPYLYSRFLHLPFTPLSTPPLFKSPPPLPPPPPVRFFFLPPPRKKAKTPRRY